MSVKGPLIVWLLSLWGRTTVYTEGHLQTTVLQAQGSTQEPALNIATSVYDPNLVERTEDRWGETEEMANIMCLTY